MKRIILGLFCTLLIMNEAMNAQISKGDIGVNGLTCSQCSRSVYNALTKLDFIANVEMDLNETIAHISFNREPDFDDIANAIVNAGYKVRDMYFDYKKNNAISENIITQKKYCIAMNEDFPSDKENIRIQIIGKKYNADKQQNDLITAITTSNNTACQKYYYALLQNN